MKPHFVPIFYRRRESVVVLTGTCPIFPVYHNHRTFFSATWGLNHQPGPPLPSPSCCLLLLCYVLFLQQPPFHTLECVKGHVRQQGFRSQEEISLTLGAVPSSLSTPEYSSFPRGTGLARGLTLLFASTFPFMLPLAFASPFSHVGIC